MTDAATMAFLVKSMAYGIPTALLAFAFIVLQILVKYQQAKSERDRTEHMKKWQSMIDLQHEAATNQKDVNHALVQSHKEEIGRMLNLQERSTSSLEAVAHNLSIITQRFEIRQVCPLDRRKGEPIHEPE